MGWALSFWEAEPQVDLATRRGQGPGALHPLRISSLTQFLDPKGPSVA